MTINLTVPQTMQELRPRITVVGVGGGGCNAVNNMINADLDGVDFLVANTDGQALAHSLASRKIQLGSAITQGLGAGSKPEIGRAAAEESIDDVMAELADCNMVFITAGMGGGTGTGAAPVIARAARERGILTVAVITKPFEFEGQRRMTQAEAGIEELQAYVDTLIIIPNQNLFRLANERTTFADAFHMADTVLHQGVCGVTDLMIKPGMINLDFADIRAVMTEMGKAMMGTGEASGETRATQAAEAAINNPLLDDTTMKGASALLINVTGGMDMTLFEVDEAANRIRKEVDPDAVIIFGSAFDEKLDGIMRVSVVATGIHCEGMAQPLPGRMAPPLARSSTIIPPRPSIPASVESLAMAAERAENETDAADGPASGETPDEEQLDIADAVAAATATDDGPSADEVEVEMPATAETGTEPMDDDALPPATDAVSASADEMAETPDMGAETGSSTAENTAPASDDVAPDEVTGGMFANPAAAVKPTDELSQTNVRREPFIPGPTAEVPDEDNLPQAAEPPAEQPRLIKRLTGLWSTKPGDEQKGEQTPAQTSEPPAPAAPSILDLPRADMVQEGRRGTGQTTLDNSDDDLDIPAFLRRQAN